MKKLRDRFFTLIGQLLEATVIGRPLGGDVLQGLRELADGAHQHDRPTKRIRQLVHRAQEPPEDVQELLPLCEGAAKDLDVWVRYKQYMRVSNGGRGRFIIFAYLGTDDHAERALPMLRLLRGMAATYWDGVEAMPLLASAYSEHIALVSLGIEAAISTEGGERVRLTHNDLDDACNLLSGREGPPRGPTLQEVGIRTLQDMAEAMRMPEMARRLELVISVIEGYAADRDRRAAELRDTITLVLALFAGLSGLAGAVATLSTAGWSLETSLTAAGVALFVLVVPTLLWRSARPDDFWLEDRCSTLCGAVAGRMCCCPRLRARRPARDAEVRLAHLDVHRDNANH